MRNLAWRGRLEEPPQIRFASASKRSGRVGHVRSSRWSRVASALVVAGVAGLASPAASAQAADGCANAALRTGPSAQLPDCRAYELVTPADKHAGTIQETTSGSGASFVGYPTLDGERFAVGTVAPIGGTQTGATAVYVSRRTAEGWTTRGVLPAGCSDVYKNNNFLIAGAFSADFSRFFLAADATQNCAPGDTGGSDYYSTDTYGSLTWESTDGGPRTTTTDRGGRGISADGRHVLFATAEQLVLPLESGRTMGLGLYDRTDGRTIPVGLGNDGAPINPCGVTFPGSTVQGRVSEDGRVIFFLSDKNAAIPACDPATGHGGQLYARIDGTRTVQISRSVAAAPDPAGAKEPELLHATMRGNRAFFRSGEALTDDAPAGGGIYEYDLTPVLAGTASVGTLRLLGSGPGDWAGRLNVLGMAVDGSIVYFTTPDALDQGATAGAANLYVSVRGAAPEFVATMSVPFPNATVSRDGTKIAYLSTAPGGTNQVYLHRLGTSGVSCVSCPPSGTPKGHASFGSRPMNGAPSLGLRRLVTDDGKVYFTSPDRLVPRDVNDAIDVYEYVDGRVQLLSTGTSPRSSLLMGMANEGRDVFFATNDSLVVQDFDAGDQDIYVARVGGGFPAPPVAPEPCVGDACQRPVAPPQLPGVGTAGFFGPPSEPSPTAPPVRAVTVKRPKAVKGTSVRLSVTAPAAGRIQVSGSGLRRVAKTAKARRAYRVTVRLSARASRTLARRGRVNLRATVRFAPNRGARSSVRVPVTFRAKPAASPRRSTAKGGR